MASRAAADAVPSASEGDMTVPGKGGRPRLDRKTWGINVRVTDDERAKIQAHFEERGLAVSAAVLDFLLTEAGIIREPGDDGS